MMPSVSWSQTTQIEVLRDNLYLDHKTLAQGYNKSSTSCITNFTKFMFHKHLNIQFNGQIVHTVYYISEADTRAFCIVA